MLLMFLMVYQVFSNDKFDLIYVSVNSKTNDPLFHNIKELSKCSSIQKA